MHALFLTHYYPPEVNAPASRTHEHARQWVASGATVHVITCNPNCPDGIVFDGYENPIRRQEETIDGVRVTRVWTYLAPNAGTVRRIANYVSYMVSAIWAAVRAPRPDVIVATSPQFFCGWAGVFAARLRRRPFVLEVRDIWPLTLVELGGKSPSHPLLRWMQRTTTP